MPTVGAQPFSALAVVRSVRRVCQPPCPDPPSWAADLGVWQLFREPAGRGGGACRRQAAGGSAVLPGPQQALLWPIAGFWGEAPQLDPFTDLRTQRPPPQSAALVAPCPLNPPPPPPPPPRSPQAIAAQVGAKGSDEELCRNEKVRSSTGSPLYPVLCSACVSGSWLLAPMWRSRLRGAFAFFPCPVSPSKPCRHATPACPLPPFHHTTPPCPLSLQVKKELLAQLTATGKEGKLKVRGGGADALAQRPASCGHVAKPS